jgi:hypothetical protein
VLSIRVESGEVCVLVGSTPGTSSVSGVSLGVSRERAASCDSREVSTSIVSPCFSMVLSYDSRGSVSQSSTESSTSREISCSVSKTSGVAYD